MKTDVVIRMTAAEVRDALIDTVKRKHKGLLKDWEGELRLRVFESCHTFNGIDLQFCNVNLQ